MVIRSFPSTFQKVALEHKFWFLLVALNHSGWEHLKSKAVGGEKSVKRVGRSVSLALGALGVSTALWEDPECGILRGPWVAAFQGTQQETLSFTSICLPTFLSSPYPSHCSLSSERAVGPSSCRKRLGNSPFITFNLHLLTSKVLLAQPDLLPSFLPPPALPPLPSLGSLLCNAVHPLLDA